MSEAPDTPPPRWNQFTIERILLATLWVAVCFGTLTFANGYKPNGKDPGMAFFIVSMTIVITAPFIALGSLFGRPVGGLIIGFLAVVALSTFLFVVFNGP